jgi:type III pantothenate kinase
MTLDLIDGTQTYLGGNISPGMRMRLQAMHHFTARLPFPEPALTLGRVGTSTEKALRHGGQMGLVYEVEGLYHRLSIDFPNLQLLLTGGDAGWLAEKLSVPFNVYPNLVLRGLNQILSYYVQNES